MRNAGLDEAQAGIKISGKNINNLRYADDNILMAESKEELKSSWLKNFNLLIKVKEESEKAGLKFNIQKTKIMASGPITSWQIGGETMETVTDFIFLDFKITVDGDCSHEIFFFSFISWRLITLQYCSGFCHTLTWISHGFTWTLHPDPPSHLPLYPVPLGLPSAPGPSTCLMHPTWAGDLFHPR